jgi:hypothetical protein
VAEAGDGDDPAAGDDGSLAAVGEGTGDDAGPADGDEGTDGKGGRRDREAPA